MKSGRIHVPRIAKGKTPKPIDWVELSTGCFVSTSHLANDKGYPVIRRKMKPQPIMRFVYEQKYGLIPKGMVIRHTCDNPACINIDHLLMGTLAENNKDRHVRGRDARNNGIVNGNSKLNESQVREILSNPHIPLATFAKKFNVNKTTISDIRNRNTWPHIELV